MLRCAGPAPLELTPDEDLLRADPRGECSCEDGSKYEHERVGGNEDDQGYGRTCPDEEQAWYQEERVQRNGPAPPDPTANGLLRGLQQRVLGEERLGGVNQSATTSTEPSVLVLLELSQKRGSASGHALLCVPPRVGGAGQGEAPAAGRGCLAMSLERPAVDPVIRLRRRALRRFGP